MMRKLFNTTLALLASGLMLGACEKNVLPEIAEPVTSGASVKFFFHVDGAPQANFYLDNEKITAVAPNADGVVLGNGYGAVYPSNAYVVVPAGNFTMSVIDTMKAGGSADMLASSKVNLEEGKNYSAYLVGTTSNYETFITEDKLPPASNTAIYWRFMNTMANMPYKVDVYAVRNAIPATETSPAVDAMVIPLGTNLGFKEHGEYKELLPGSYAFKVYPTGTVYDPLTTTPYIQSKVNVASLGRVYTTQIRGNYAPAPKSNQIDYWRER
jgi:hypothetical protein